MNIIAGLSEIAAKAGSSNITLDQIVRIAAPKSFSKKDLIKLQRDCEILLECIRKNPEKVQALIKLGLAGNMLAAADVARELKLGKGNSDTDQGGFIIIVIIIIIILVASAGELH